jgi:hypothetical protein
MRDSQRNTFLEGFRIMAVERVANTTSGAITLQSICLPVDASVLFLVQALVANRTCLYFEETDELVLFNVLE